MNKEITVNKKEMLIIYMHNIDYRKLEKEIEGKDKVYLVYKYEKEKEKKELTIKEKFFKAENDKKEESFLNKLSSVKDVDIRTVKNPQRFITHLEEKSPRHNVTTINNLIQKIKTKEKEYKITTKFKKGSNLILWDIENISFKNLDAIFSKLNVIDKLYIVSVNNISEFKRAELKKSFNHFNIEIVTGHDDSDQKIIDLIKEEYESYKKVTIISSDTDFVNTINFVLDEGKEVKIIARDVQKKGMLMRTKLDHPKLRIETI